VACAVCPSGCVPEDWDHRGLHVASRLLPAARHMVSPVLTPRTATAAARHMARGCPHLPLCCWQRPAPPGLGLASQHQAEAPWGPCLWSLLTPEAFSHPQTCHSKEAERELEAHADPSTCPQGACASMSLRSAGQSWA